MSIFNRKKVKLVKHDARTLISIFWRSHLLALLKHPFTLVTRILSIGLATLRNLVSVSNRRPPPTGEPFELYQGEGMDLKRFHKRLNRMLYYKPQMGTVEPLIDGDDYFPELLKCINNSKSSIIFRVYIFDNDDVAVEVADHLKKRAGDIKVKILMDDLGSLFAARKVSRSLPEGFEPPEDIDRYLNQEKKVRVRRSPNPFFTGDHNKVIIIDRETLFTGGMNIGREYRHDWHDIMLKVHGPVISIFEKQFRQAWAHAGWFGDLGNFLAFFKPRKKDIPAPGGHFPIHVLSTSSLRAEIYKANLAAINNAKKEIFLENPYFSNNNFIDAIIKARHRGVDVRVIFPGKNDVGVMHKNNEILVNTLLDNHVRVYIYPRMSHVKAIYVDGWVSIGSANYDMLSLHINQESNIAFSDPDTAAKIRKNLFEKDFEDSREITEKNDVDWSHHVSEIIANQL